MFVQFYFLIVIHTFPQLHSLLVYANSSFFPTSQSKVLYSLEKYITFSQVCLSPTSPPRQVLIMPGRHFYTVRMFLHMMTIIFNTCHNRFDCKPGCATRLRTDVSSRLCIAHQSVLTTVRSPEELKIVQCKTSCYVLGRSGTGYDGSENWREQARLTPRPVKRQQCSSRCLESNGHGKCRRPVCPSHVRSL